MDVEQGKLIAQVTYRGLGTLLDGRSHHGYKRIFREAAKKGVLAACEHWQTRFLPLHFQPIAVMRYRYPPLSGDYRRRKLRTKGHVTPLVYSGQSRDKITHQLVPPRLKQMPDRLSGRVKIRAPAHFSMQKLPDGRSRNRALLSITTPQERMTFAKIIDKIVAQAVRMRAKGRVVRRKVV